MRYFLLALGMVLLPSYARSGTGACLTTLVPQPAFVPPAPYDTEHLIGAFWYGNDALWTRLSVDPVWHTAHNVDTQGGYVTKLIFWSASFEWKKEMEPELVVTAQRSDGDAPAVAVAHANAVFLTHRNPAMMTGIRIPTTGCWEITAYYKGHALRFTVSVEP